MCACIMHVHRRACRMKGLSAEDRLILQIIKQAATTGEVRAMPPPGAPSADL